MLNNDGGRIERNKVIFFVCFVILINTVRAVQNTSDVVEKCYIFCPDYDVQHRCNTLLDLTV